MSKIKVDNSKEIYLGFKSYVDEIASDEEKLNLVLDCIGKAVENEDNAENRKSLKRIMEVYKEGNCAKRKIIIDCLIEGIFDTTSAIEDRIAEYECSLNGHKFAPWEKVKETKTEFINYDNIYAENHPKRGTYSKEERVTYLWKRYCKICGEFEVSEDTPKQVVAAQTRQYKKSKKAED